MHSIGLSLNQLSTWFHPPTFNWRHTFSSHRTCKCCTHNCTCHGTICTTRYHAAMHISTVNKHCRYTSRPLQQGSDQNLTKRHAPCCNASQRTQREDGMVRLCRCDSAAPQHWLSTSQCRDMTRPAQSKKQLSGGSYMWNIAATC